MEELQQTQDPRLERLNAALASQDIPHIYTNGGASALRNSDVIMVLERNNSPVAVLNMSYTTAKSLARNLSQLIANLEKKSKQTIMTPDVVDDILSQQAKGQS